MVVSLECSALHIVRSERQTVVNSFIFYFSCIVREKEERSTAFRPIKPQEVGMRLLIQTTLLTQLSGSFHKTSFGGPLRI